MKSQIESNSRLSIGNNIGGIPLKNMLPNKDDRLVKRNKLLPSIVSCDLISDDQSLLSSRTLSGDSQCLESYPYLSLIDQRQMSHSVVDSENKTADQVNINYENSIDREVVYGYKNNFFDPPDVNSVKGVDNKLKQNNERRAGRPPLDRSDYFCQICSATKTPQWRYISVCSVESKLRVCNACWMKQRKKRDGKCLSLQIGMSNANLGANSLLKSSKVCINKENFDPQRQNYSGIINNVSYKMNSIPGKEILSVNTNATRIGNGVCENGTQNVCESTSGYISDGCAMSGGIINCQSSNISNGSFIKNISFRSSPYSVSPKLSHTSNSSLSCSCDLTKGCFCKHVIEPNNISLSAANHNVQKINGLNISNTNSVRLYCQEEAVNISLDSISPLDEDRNSNGILFTDSKGSLLEYQTQDMSSIYNIYDKNTEQLDGAESTKSPLNITDSLKMNERIIFDVDGGIIEGSDESKVNEHVSGSINSCCTNQSPNKSVMKSQNQNQDLGYSNSIGKMASNFIGTRYSIDNSRGYVISCGKLSISTPVHHQNSTTVSPDTNYCNISSYASSPCQSFTAFDGPFLEDPNRTMCVSMGNSFFYSSTDAGRWNDDSTIQNQMSVLDCPSAEDNSDKVETLSFTLGQEVPDGLSQNNEHIEQDQASYSIFNKQIELSESWSGECLPVDMFCVQSEKAALSSEVSTTSNPHFSINPKELSSSSVCTIPLGYPTEVPQDNEHSGQNDCATWDFDPSSTSCIETWQNPLWYDSFSSGFCKLS